MNETKQVPWPLLKELLRVCPRIRRYDDGDVWVNFPDGGVSLSVTLDLAKCNPNFREKVLEWSTDMKAALDKVEEAVKT